MPSYRVFGLRLDCDFELPELPEVDAGAGADWRIETRDAPAPAVTAGQLGIDTVYGEVRVRAYSAPGLLRLAFDDTGSFDILRGERVIAWYPGSDPLPAAVRADLLGRVLALAAHADGRLPLHASAVSIRGRAIAFLGPKHAGKSTMALALVRHGARLLTDDTLVVRFDPQGIPVASPGVQQVRLWEDSSRALGAEAWHQSAGAKPTVSPLDPECLERDEVVLAACYVLHRAEVGDESPSVIRRERLAPVHAAMAIVQYSKLGSLAGGAEGVAQLGRATSLARTPLYVAVVRRDLGRLADAAATIAAWHGEAPMPNVATIA